VLDANPLAGAGKGTLPQLPSPDTSQHVLAPEEISAVAEHIRTRYSDREAVLVLVMGICALRWGEAVALARQHVDLRGNLRIRRNVQRLTAKPGRREWVYGEPKTERGRRDVPMPDELHDQLRPLLEGLAPDGLIFHSLRTPSRPWDGGNFA
jgi:integrase